ncbi:hypothetical protein AAFZ21_001652 [Vibrio fluvialis]
MKDDLILAILFPLFVGVVLFVVNRYFKRKYKESLKKSARISQEVKALKAEISKGNNESKGKSDLNQHDINVDDTALKEYVRNMAGIVPSPLHLSVNAFKDATAYASHFKGLTGPGKVIFVNSDKDKGGDPFNVIADVHPKTNPLKPKTALE